MRIHPLKLNLSFHIPKPRTVEERNLRHLYLDMAWLSILSGVAGTYTRVFAVRLGASSFVLGLMSSAPALLSILWSIPAARLVEHIYGRRVKVVVVGRLIARFGYLVIALAPWLVGQGYTPYAILAILTLESIPGAMMDVAFTSIMGEVIPIEKRARVISTRYAIHSIVMMVTVFVAGRVLEILSFPVSYQLLFIVGFATSLVSIYYYSLLQVPKVEDPPISAGRQESVAMLAPLKELSAHRPFLRFLLGSFVFHWGMAMSGPLFSLYWVRHLQASDGWISFLSIAETLTTMLSYFLWGRIASQRGHRPVLVLSTLGLSFYPILTGLSRTVQPLLLLSLATGVMAAGLNLTFFNVLLEVCPERRRPSYLALNRVQVHLAAFIAPMLGVALAERWGIVTSFMASGGVSLLGFLLFYLLRLDSPKATNRQAQG